MKPAHKSPHETLIELINLRNTGDVDPFMDLLFEALTGEFKHLAGKVAADRQTQEAVEVMILHFQKKEEYEKCAILKSMMETRDQQE